MNEIPNIITERVDDIPLLLEQMQRMELPTLIDTHFPAHGNWYGLSLGGSATEVMLLPWRDCNGIERT